MIITFVRHAEVIEEYLGKYNGHIDIPLSQNGHKQAQELAEKLKEQNYDLVYCSDLLRAKETLSHFNIDCEVIYSQELREKSWGVHEGKSYYEIAATGLKYEGFEQWISELDGESVEEFQNRVNSAYKKILKSDAEKILVMTHSGFIKTLVSQLKNIPLEDSFTTKLPYCGMISIDTKKLY